MGTARVAGNLRPLTIELAGSEGWMTGDSRQVGNFQLGLRRYLYRGTYLRLALSHNHEIPEAVLLEEPFAALSGSADGIDHRSGVEAGTGWTWTLPWEPLKRRLGVKHDLSVAWFPGGEGVHVYGGFEWGLTVNLGPTWGWAKRRFGSHGSGLQ